jgi:hypothetical protein
MAKPSNEHEACWSKKGKRSYRCSARRHKALVAENDSFAPNLGPLGSQELRSEADTAIRICSK